jgi:hypothetical protein
MASVFDWFNGLLGGGDPEAQAAAQNSMAMQPNVLGYAQDVLSGKYAREGVLGQSRPYDPALTYRQNVPDLRASLEPATEVALSVGPGAIRPRATSTVAGKGVQQANPEVAAPQIGLGTDQPLFNLENLQARPDVPQVGIERMPDPKKGVPDWWKRQIEDPATAEQYKAILQKGRDVAGDENALGWWNTFPLRERTIGEFGEAAGDPRWRSDMRLLSATSPRHAFPPNISQASYFGNMIAEGRPLPELVKRYSEKNPNAFNWVPAESAPTGYANFPLHIQNIQNLLDPETRLLTRPYPLENPKPATMDRNLVGDWSRPTIDVRDLKAMGATTKGGKPMSSVDPADLYGYTEQNFHIPLSKELGLDPAQMQSSTWVGVPEFFKEFDKSGTSSALGTLEDIIRQNSRNLGLTPEQTFTRGWLRKEFPLRWNLKE